MQGCCLGFLLYLEAGLRNTLISMLSWETIHGFYTSIILSKKNKIPSSSFTFFSSTLLFCTGHCLTFFLLAHFWGITLQFRATWWRISIFLEMRQKVKMRLKFLTFFSKKLSFWCIPPPSLTVKTEIWKCAFVSTRACSVLHSSF